MNDQQLSIFFYDGDDILVDLVPDWYSKPNAEDYAANRVYHMGEGCYAQICDEENEVVMRIDYEELACLCGCGRRATAGYQGCASRECAVKAFL